MRTAVATDSAQSDRTALLEIYRTAGGESWTNQEGWHENAEDLSTWFGVARTGDGRVLMFRSQAKSDPSIRPIGNNLHGAFPHEICGLTALRELFIVSTQLTGPIPSELTKLVALKELCLHHNQLEGKIPPELGEMVSLQKLSLHDNHLTGPIPPELCKLVALKKLSLHHNRLKGSIPPELGKMRALRKLSIHHNLLTGSIPSELGEMEALEEVDLQNNQFTGFLPPELKKLRLLHLDVRFNKLTSLGPVEDAWDLIQVFIADYKAREMNGKPLRKSGKTLRLSGNPWVMPPEAVVEEGLSAVEGYLEDVRSAANTGSEVMKIQLLKVVLIGSSQAGKTSLMNSIVHGEAKPTEGTPEEVSTVGIQLRRHSLKFVRVEFYDCAGQIDYAGMHQIFLSRRALYLLVWDANKCQGRSGNALDAVIEEDVMSWLYTLHLRAPDSTVILVANKCDGSIDNFSETVRKVRTRVTELLSQWHDSRGFNIQDAIHVSTLNLLAETSKVSCRDGLGLVDLVDVVTAQSCASLSVPPSWDLALVFLDALRDKKEPLEAARDRLGLSSSGPAHYEDRPSSFYIPKKALTYQWNELLRQLTRRGEVQCAAGRAACLNPDRALEGSLWICEFAGQLLRVDGGIFLDVGLLSDVLNPIVDHNLPRRIFPNSKWNESRSKLVTTGVLSSAFALHLWRNVFPRHSRRSSTSTFENALFDVLVKLALATPIGEEKFREGVDRSPWVSSHADCIHGHQDMLVWRWLPKHLGEHGEATLKTLVEQLGDGAQKVTLKWQFDSAGAPHGLMGRLMAQCHVIGEAEEALCWRSGAVFRSSRMPEATHPPFVVEIRYSTMETVLSATVRGTLSSERLWVALRFVASLMVHLSKDWPGALWAGWVMCPGHPSQRLHLATPTEAMLGTPLVPPTSDGCVCRRDAGTVVGQVVARLGNVINTKTGDPFLLCGDLDADEPKEAEDAGGGVGSWYACYDDAFSMWTPHAWKTAATCLTSSFALFMTLVVEDLSATKTYVLVAVIIFLVAGACASACVAFKRDRAEQQLDVGVELGHIA